MIDTASSSFPDQGQSPRFSTRPFPSRSIHPSRPPSTARLHILALLLAGVFLVLPPCCFRLFWVKVDHLVLLFVNFTLVPSNLRVHISLSIFNLLALLPAGVFLILPPLGVCLSWVKVDHLVLPPASPWRLPFPKQRRSPRSSARFPVASAVPGSTSITSFFRSLPRGVCLSWVKTDHLVLPLASPWRLPFLGQSRSPRSSARFPLASAFPGSKSITSFFRSPPRGFCLS